MESLIYDKYVWSDQLKIQIIKNISKKRGSTSWICTHCFPSSGMFSQAVVFYNIIQ